MTTTPEALRRSGQHQAESAADMRVIALVDAVIDAAVESGEVFSANSLRDRMPTTASQGLIGARFDRARKRGLVEFVAYEISDLPSCRGAVIRQWRGVA